MELYLKWLKLHERAAGEKEPLGIILCADKDQQHVELLEMEKSGIHVATYLTAEVPKAELERKLHDAVRLARARLAQRPTPEPAANLLLKNAAGARKRKSRK